MMIIYLIVIFSLKSVNCIQCYQCYLAEKPYYINEKVVRICTQFDYSDDYLVDCPKSTFCYKKTVRDVFYGTEYVREERGCALQLYTGQRYDEILGWKQESRVVENAYQRGCKKVEDYGQKIVDVEECYCDSYNLCNSGMRIEGQLAMFVTSFGFIKCFYYG
ncbi:uncharacterized protein [Euwallacea fornicatus]|uniref:uncharacterized protein n=1 Tax=Euwallacea fornicatus TaxID=995702 RepID=UPI00338DA36D